MLFERLRPEALPPVVPYAAKALIDIEHDALMNGGLRAEEQQFLELPDGPPPESALNALIANRLTWQIRETFISYPEDDRRVGLAFIQKTDAMADLLRVGMKVERWIAKFGREGLATVVDPGAYSPPLIAETVTFGVRTVFGFESNRQLKRFLRRDFVVAPAFRNYLENLR